MAYLFKHGKGKRFFLLFLLMLVPCAITAYYLPLSNSIAYFFDYKPHRFTSFNQLWLSSFNHSAASLSAIACALVLFVLCIAYVTSMITRHVRVGEFTFPKILYSVNENFFPALAVTIFFFITVFATSTLYDLFLFMWLRIPSTALGLTLSIISFLLFIFLEVYILSAASTWLPIMSLTGSFVFKSLARSFSRAKFHKNVLGFALVTVLTLLAVSVGGYFARNIWYVQWIIHTVAYTACAVVALVYNTLLYCESESVKREDLAKSYFGR